MNNICLMCGEIVPEGIEVCPSCKSKVEGTDVMNDNPKKNSEGYTDLTAYYGSKKQVRNENQIENAHKQLINSFLSLANLAGFEVVGRISLKHRRTGRVFK